VGVNDKLKMIRSAAASPVRTVDVPGIAFDFIVFAFKKLTIKTMSPGDNPMSAAIFRKPSF